MSTVPVGSQVGCLRNAVLTGGESVDVYLSGGRIARVERAGGTVIGPDDIDLTGYLLVPATAEPHAHLDKALTFDEISPPMGDLSSAIAAWEAYTPSMTEDSVAIRARAAAMTLLAHGTTAVRSHVNILRGSDPFRGIRALVRVREELADLMDLQIVAMAPYFATESDVHRALDLGADLVGGHPHQTPDPRGNLESLLAVADAREVGVDIHTDERLDPEMLTLEMLAESVVGWPESRSVTASHCVSLGMVEPDVRSRVIEAVKVGRVGVVSLPITNLYLQGWDTPVATPRGLTAVRSLIDAGVMFAAGADNVRDPYNPLGRSDALETAMLLVTAAHLHVDEAYRAVSAGAREVMSLPEVRIEAGSPAELLAIKAGSLVEAVARAPLDRLVFHRGHLVSASRTELVQSTPEHLVQV
ncbi:MAG: amidohydrolase family protein [Actinomycetota bacterium]|nr:amidohydrolase family protein [Actinomycetota bacterium]